MIFCLPFSFGFRDLGSRRREMQNKKIMENVTKLNTNNLFQRNILVQIK